MRCTLGVDIGTSSSKGVLAAEDGSILATATRAHDVDRPRTGWVEMDGRVWWDEFVAISRELLASVPDAEVVGVGVSGMGPCILLADENDEPVRPAILYGVDTRSTAQIARLTAELGEDEIARVGGSSLTSQAGGAKIVWVAEEEPDAWARAKRLFMPASWLARRLRFWSGAGATTSSSRASAKKPRHSCAAAVDASVAVGVGVGVGAAAKAEPAPDAAEAGADAAAGGRKSSRSGGRGVSVDGTRLPQAPRPSSSAIAAHRVVKLMDARARLMSAPPARPHRQRPDGPRRSASSRHRRRSRSSSCG